MRRRHGWPAPGLTVLPEVSDFARFPDSALLRVIESHASRLSDPVDRLRFLRRCADMADVWAERYSQTPANGWSRQAAVLTCLEEATGSPVSLGLRERALLWAIRGREVAEGAARAATLRRVAPAAAAVALVLGVSTSAGPDEPARVAPPPLPTTLEPGAPVNEVWLAERTDRFELYSNGLQISDEFLTPSQRRAYVTLPASGDLTDEEVWSQAEAADHPAGIVYHATVSEIAPPFAAEHSARIRRHGRQLLRYISEQRLYHFVIDRFGRAFRIIAEEEIAYHAGWSLWTGGDRRFFGLNDSFIGVACETRPEAADPAAPRELGVTSAQVATLRLMTEVLRQRYQIPAENCVPHEAVSVNPANHLIGYHTDWAGRFPFQEIGLPDNYQLPPASVAEWGFRYDGLLEMKVGGTVWPGVLRAERIFRRQAAAHGESVEQRRRQLRDVYRRLLKRLRERSRS